MFELLLKITFERNKNYHKDYHNHVFALYYSKLSWTIHYRKNYHKNYHNHVFASYHSKLSWTIHYRKNYRKNYHKDYHKDHHNHVLKIFLCLVSWLRDSFAWFVLLRRNEFSSIKASFIFSLYKIKLKIDV
jgi:hypothetical protein